MEILNTTVIMEEASWFSPAIIICGIIAIICFNIIIITYNDGLRGILIIIFILSVLTLLVIGTWEPQVETGRNRYEVTIDEDISITEIYSKYDVIEQRGKIWILEDKK